MEKRQIARRNGLAVSFAAGEYHSKLRGTKEVLF
jgi:hypothetical protein